MQYHLASYGISLQGFFTNVQCKEVTDEGEVSVLFNGDAVDSQQGGAMQPINFSHTAPSLQIHANVDEKQMKKCRCGADSVIINEYKDTKTGCVTTEFLCIACARAKGLPNGDM